MKKNNLLIWAAGFIDGEGYIGIRRRVRSSQLRGIAHSPVICVGQVDPAPLKILKQLFGGIIHTNKKHKYKKEGKPMSQWVLSSRQAEKALIKLLPYLICKNKEAKITLKFYKIGTFSRRNIIDDISFEKRENLYNKLKLLRFEKYNRKQNGKRN